MCDALVRGVGGVATDGVGMYCVSKLFDYTAWFKWMNPLFVNN